jgi:hypothetical protein
VYKDAQVGQYYVEGITKQSPADVVGLSASLTPTHKKYSHCRLR